MIDLSGMVSIPFIKKRPFTGSYRGMRYMLCKKDRLMEVGTEGQPEKTEPVIRGFIWPEPFNYESTAEENKRSRDFPFHQDGMLEAVAWLNEEYEAGTYE